MSNSQATINAYAKPAATAIEGAGLPRPENTNDGAPPPVASPELTPELVSAVLREMVRIHANAIEDAVYDGAANGGFGLIASIAVDDALERAGAVRPVIDVLFRALPHWSQTIGEYGELADIKRAVYALLDTAERDAAEHAEVAHDDAYALASDSLVDRCGALARSTTDSEVQAASRAAMSTVSMLARPLTGRLTDTANCHYAAALCASGIADHLGADDTTERFDAFVAALRAIPAAPALAGQASN